MANRNDIDYKKTFRIVTITKVNPDKTVDVRESGRPNDITGISVPDTSNYPVGGTMILGAIGGDRNNIGLICDSPYA